MLIKIRKHIVYSIIYLLVKLTLVFPMATMSHDHRLEDAPFREQFANLDKE